MVEANDSKANLHGILRAIKRPLLNIHNVALIFICNTGLHQHQLNPISRFVRPKTNNICHVIVLKGKWHD